MNKRQRKKNHKKFRDAISVSDNIERTISEMYAANVATQWRRQLDEFDRVLLYGDGTLDFNGERLADIAKEEP